MNVSLKCECLLHIRLGIDDEANVANFVETETVVSIMVGFDLLANDCIAEPLRSEMIVPMYLVISKSGVQVRCLTNILVLMNVQHYCSSIILVTTELWPEATATAIQRSNA